NQSELRVVVDQHEQLARAVGIENTNGHLTTSSGSYLLIDNGLADLLDDVRRRRIDLANHSVQIDAGQGDHVQRLLLSVRAKLRIGQSLHEGLANGLDAFLRDIGRHHERPREYALRIDDLENLPLLGRLRKVEAPRHATLVELGIARNRFLDNHPHRRAGAEPIRTLPQDVRVALTANALHLAALHGQRNIERAAIAADQLELDPQDIHQRARHVVRGSAAG